MADPSTEVIFGELPFPRPSGWPAAQRYAPTAPNQLDLTGVLTGSPDSPATMGALEQSSQGDSDRPDHEIQDQSFSGQWCFKFHIMYTVTGDFVSPIRRGPYANVDAANAVARRYIAAQKYLGSRWDLRYVKVGKEGQLRMMRACRDVFVCCYVCKYVPNGDKLVWERSEELEEEEHKQAGGFRVQSPSMDDPPTGGRFGDIFDDESELREGKVQDRSFLCETAPDLSAKDNESHSGLGVEEAT